MLIQSYHNILYAKTFQLKMDVRIYNLLIYNERYSMSMIEI